MAIKDLIRQFSQGSSNGDWSEVQRIADKFAERRAAIDADDKLTITGKAAETTKLVRETLDIVEKWRAPLLTKYDTYGKHLTDELRDAVTPPRSSDPADRMDAALLRAEVRRAVDGMNAQQIEILYRQGDGTVRQALEELPSISVKRGAVIVRPFVSDKLRQDVLVEAARLKLPETSAKLDTMRHAETNFQHAGVGASERGRRRRSRRSEARARDLESGQVARWHPLPSASMLKTSRRNVWPSAKAANAVTEITQETKRAIRTLIVESIRDGIPPREAAHRIRSMVGMTKRQALAAANFRVALVDSGLTAGRVDAAVERYIAKKIRERSVNIARTEIMSGLVRGQAESMGASARGGAAHHQAGRRHHRHRRRQNLQRV